MQTLNIKSVHEYVKRIKMSEFMSASLDADFAAFISSRKFSAVPFQVLNETDNSSSNKRTGLNNCYKTPPCLPKETRALPSRRRRATRRR